MIFDRMIHLWTHKRGNVTNLFFKEVLNFLMNCGIVVPAMFIRVMAIVFTVVPEKYQLYF